MSMSKNVVKTALRPLFNELWAILGFWKIQNRNSQFRFEKKVDFSVYILKMCWKIEKIRKTAMRAQCFWPKVTFSFVSALMSSFPLFFVVVKITVLSLGGGIFPKIGGGIFLNLPSYNKPIKKMKLSGQTVSIIVIDFELKYKIIAFVIISIS